MSRPAGPVDSHRVPPRPPLEVSTRQRLLEVGERLFGLHGFERTTTRQICKEAGVHQDAIHYHFGTKDEFVRAILDANIDRLDRHLASRLQDALPDGESPIRGLARAVVGATASTSREKGLGRYHSLFIAAMMADRKFRPAVLGRSSLWSDRLVAALTPLTPGLSEHERIYRVAVVGFILVNSLPEHPIGDVIGEWVANVAAPSEDELQAMLTDAVAAVLSGPPGAKPGRSDGAAPARRRR